MINQSYNILTFQSQFIYRHFIASLILKRKIALTISPSKTLQSPSKHNHMEGLFFFFIREWEEWKDRGILHFFWKSIFERDNIKILMSNICFVYEYYKENKCI